MGPGRLADEYTHAAGRFVREVMTRDVCAVTEDTPVADMVALMEQRRVKRLPVMRGTQLVGIVTRQNLLRALAGAAAAAPAIESDAAIRERLIAELKNTPWAPAGIDPVVTDGKVRLVGTIFDDRQREALIVAAENVPGVKAVEDELIWIEPTSGMVVEPRAA
jgi:CBS-domain-containing membrane protein